MTENELAETEDVFAVGALGLGVAGSYALVRSDGRTAELAQQTPSQVLVFGYEYNPGVSFEVVDRLQQGTVDDVLGRQVGDNDEPIVSDPADYTGYVVRYQPDQDASEYAFVFVRSGSLPVDETFAFGADATFFSSEANLLTAGISSGGQTTTPEEDGETTTPEEDGETTTTEEDGDTTTTEEDGEATTTEEDGEATTTTTEETTTAPEETTTTGETNTTTSGETTTQDVVVNATGTTTEGG